MTADAKDAQVQGTSVDEAEDEVTKVTEPEGETTEPDTLQAQESDSTDADGDGTESATDEDDPEGGDAEDDSDGKPEDESGDGEDENTEGGEDHSELAADVTGDDGSESESKDGESEGEGGEPKTEDEPEQLIAIVPLSGSSRSATDMLPASPVVFYAIRIGTNSGASNDYGAQRLMPAMSAPENWELGSVVALRHGSNRAHCGWWRLCAVITHGANGTPAVQELENGTDITGEHPVPASRRKDMVYVKLDLTSRKRVNHITTPEFAVSEKALADALNVAIERRQAAKAAAKAKADAEKAAAAAAAAATAAEQDGLQKAIALYDEHRAENSEMEELPAGRAETIEALVETGYLERSDEGVITFELDGEPEVVELEVTEPEAGSDGKDDDGLAEKLQTSLDAASKARDEQAIRGKHGAPRRQPQPAGQK